MELNSGPTEATCSDQQAPRKSRGLAYLLYVSRHISQNCGFQACVFLLYIFCGLIVNRMCGDAVVSHAVCTVNRYPHKFHTLSFPDTAFLAKGWQGESL